MKKGDFWNWRWSENGQNEEQLINKVRKIISPYEELIPPICYPGTTLSLNLLKEVGELITKQINMIGSHTHGQIVDGNWIFDDGEGGFESMQQIEAQVIWMVSSIIGGSPENTDGYFCGGGTEGNIQGIWMGREWLRQFPDPMKKGIVLLTSSLFHYSIAKAAEILDLGQSQYVLCPQCKKSHIFKSDASGSGLNLVYTDNLGQMSLPELEKIFHQKYQEGFRQFIIVPTVGTCLMGSIDPVEKIGKFIESKKQETDAHFYMHVDASFAGFTVPFLNPNLNFGFSVPEVMSIVMDGDKMGRLPYPAGIFLCRKRLMSLVARKVNYVRGHEDNTLSGSRSCLSQVIAWYLYRSGGKEEQRKYVQSCIDGRDKLISLIKENLSWVNILPHSPWVNFAPLEISIENGEIPEKEREGNGSLAPYHMRSDFFTTNSKKCPITVYKVCIMPHSLSHIERFVDDLSKAKGK